MTDTPPADATASTTDPDPASDPFADEARTFTQADLDRHVSDRLARERRKYADYDQLRQKAAQFDELAEAQKTELEKATERAQKAEQAAAQALAASTDRLIRAEVLAAAAQAGAVDPDAVAHLVDRTLITVGDDGAISGAAEAVAALLEQKSYLARPEPGQGPPPLAAGSPANPARPATTAGTLTREDLARMTPEDIMAAERDGRLDRLLGR